MLSAPSVNVFWKSLKESNNQIGFGRSLVALFPPVAASEAELGAALLKGIQCQL